MPETTAATQPEPEDSTVAAESTEAVDVSAAAAQDETLDINEYQLDQLTDQVGYHFASAAEVDPIPFTSAGVGVTVAADALDLDGALESAIAVARAALDEVVDAALVGGVIGAVDEGDGVYSLLFASLRDGYRDWHWTVTLSKLADAEAPAVLECELMPGADSLVAPVWVPWAERLAEFSATHDEHGNLLTPEATAGTEAAAEAKPLRVRTSSRTRTRRRLRRDRQEPASAAAAEDQAPASDSDDEPLPVADDIREFVEERDQHLHGVNFEGDDE